MVLFTTPLLVGCGGRQVTGEGHDPTPGAHLGDETATTRSVGITVVLGVFSGRPDPLWELDGGEASEVVQRVEAMTWQTQPLFDERELQKLGQAVFRLRIEPADGLAVERLQVWHGMALGWQQEVQRWSREGGDLYALLRDQATDRGYGEFFGNWD
jgi:hypothetical protein